MCFLFRMGQLISRLFKRLSSTSSSSEGNANNNNNNNKQQRRAGAAPSDHATTGFESIAEEDESSSSCPRQKVQSIPVGQSIDSAEYTALARANEPAAPTSPLAATISQEVANRDAVQGAATEPEATNDDAEGENKRVDVEEAVIKIQALIRGHLTRKALKDTQNNQLGQKQFDHESLMSNPPAAVFQLPPNANQPQRPGSPSSQLSCKPTLESIAEQPGADQSSSSSSSPPPRPTSPSMRKLALHQQHARSKLEMPPSSPIPSESNASIDLNSCCGSPASASASIDILDHNIRPNEQMASVLHHKSSLPSTNERASFDHDDFEDQSPPINVSEEPPSSVPRRYDHDDEDEDQFMAANSGGNANNTTTGNNRLTNGHQASTPPDCREQAAIRIQSAFRGYKTRKSSPYRKRSPTSSPTVGDEQRPSLFNSNNNNNNGRLISSGQNHLEEEEDEAGVAAAAAAANERLTDSGFGRASAGGGGAGGIDSDDDQEQADARFAAAAAAASAHQADERRPSRTRERSIDNIDQEHAPLAPDSQSIGSTDVLTVIANDSPPTIQHTLGQNIEPETEAKHAELEREDTLKSDEAWAAGQSQTHVALTDLSTSAEQPNINLSQSSSLGADEQSLQDCTDNQLTAALEPSPSTVATNTTTSAWPVGEDLAALEQLNLSASLGLDESDTKAAALTNAEPQRRQSDSLSQDLITDSSLLGAALSFNESVNLGSQRDVEEEPEPEVADEMADIEAEAERLVSELDSSIQALDQIGLEPPPPVQQPEVDTLGDPIEAELESDDIERRDPSGTRASQSASVEQPVDDEVPVEASDIGQGLEAAAPKTTENRESSDEDEDDDGARNKENQSSEQQVDLRLQQQQAPRRNKSRNRKRKGANKK